MKKIILTQGQVALVDDEDFEFLINWKWHYSNDGYATRTEYVNGQRAIYMNRVILERKLGHNDFEVAHHINKDKIDDRKDNLQAMTRGQHRQIHTTRKNSTSEYIGVSWAEQNQKWRAYITVNGVQMHLGYDDEEIEAARAYDRAVIEHRGRHARLNFPRSEYAGTKV